MEILSLFVPAPVSDKLSVGLKVTLEAGIMKRVKFLHMFTSILILNYTAAQQEIHQMLREKTTQYAVIVDCGSSGSRAHIYRRANSRTDPNIIQLTDPRTGKPLIKRIRPGLATFRDNPEGASEYMTPIMDFITEKVPVEYQEEAPVYFVGTAGMRMLTEQERKRLFDTMLRDIRVRYAFQDLHTAVISGNQEGAFQWLSANQHAGKIPDSVGKHTVWREQRTMGQIEMGGASAQVAFEVNPELTHWIGFALKHSRAAQKAYQASLIGVNISPGKKQAKLFSTTFLGFGSDSARGLLVDLLVRDNQMTIRGENTSQQIEDPCLPIGGSQTVNRSRDIFDNRSKTIGFSPKAEEPQVSIQLSGRGKFHQCMKLVQRVIKTAKRERLNCEQEEPCSIDMIGAPFVPYSVYKFIGTGEFYYTTHEMIQASGKFYPRTILQRTIDICHTSNSDLSDRYSSSNRVDKSRTLLECFKACWILAFLQLITRMNHKADLETISTVNGFELDWTFGALIDRLNER